MPPSESPGPFIASDEDDVPAALPLQKGWLWALAVPAALAAAAIAALVHGVVPHLNAPAARTLSAAIKAPQAAAAAPPVTETPTPEIASTPEVVPTPEVTPAPLPVVAKKSDSAAHGSLDMSSSPPASVVLDGRPLGKAPRTVEIAPGPHTVVFVHPERGRMSVSVNVSPGRTTNASANF